MTEPVPSQRERQFPLTRDHAMQFIRLALIADGESADSDTDVDLARTMARHFEIEFVEHDERVIPLAAKPLYDDDGTFMRTEMPWPYWGLLDV